MATLRSPASHEPHLVIRLPRRTVDGIVLPASGVTLELALDGSVAAHAENSGLQTLARISLSALIAEAVSPDALSAEEQPADLGRLEAELMRALEVVRRARR